MDDDSRFTEFVAERANALLRYGFALSGNPHDAADLTQEALVRLHRAWPRVRRKEDPERYTKVIMARLHISVWRRRRREQLAWALPETPLHDVLPSDGDQELWQALSGLPRKQRAVLVLRFYEQLPDAEIADVLGISQGTVRSHASLGLARLRTLIPHRSPAEGSAS
ncbi:RNA polymerase ECF sigma factor [[Actinomadura] parvosata subsp. kistnae]|uniref:RNA polymerase subunit sigma-24 n=1 Tax=[Actinomadura] parvosata subsp. kistnae TaxID=1909395 RepID=A0A1V0A9U8_9ACTN|nr:SigE family RNA polymerase sigma factor [Nonomuraea sp. ATCC 55076]AQZ67004.1 RNA polymerase subunit sigma-24 [Nonomuraea sp. ATCC 55076]SPL94823.1 RNA polymerase ECF sigma factor [Actinomadura parvosata subsp. kistnae]